MNIFEKNMISLKKKYACAGEKIEQIKINELGRIGTEQAKDGNVVLFRIVNSRKWYLNSRLNPEMASEIYADRYEIQPYGVYFVFGFSDGRCVRRLLNKCDDTNLLVICVPDKEAFAATCYYYNLEDILEDDRVNIFYQELAVDAGALIQSLVDYTRIKLLEFCILPGYDILYRENCEQFMDTVLDQMRNMIVNKSTHLSFDRVIPQRILSNTKRMIRYCNIRQLQDALTEYEVQDIPVIIVSAGPSLDKNIHLLKKAQGKALIIAVDASIRTVIQAGVRPDLLCSIDPNSPERFFSGLQLDDIFWACNQTTNSVLLEKYGKHIFYYGHYGRMWKQILENKLQYDFPTIATGGSVSTEAFMLALYLGFRKIVLIGQDLAFTGGVSHTKGIGDALGDNDEYIKKRHLVEVEGIDGTMLQTDFQMWFYKQWFEKVIRMNKESIQVIDATEGGAKIEGAEIMALQEVIDAYCTQDFDIYHIEQTILPMFSEEEQEQLQKQLQEILSMISEFQNDIDEIVGEQEKILLKMQKKKTSATEVTKLLRKLKDLNQTIDIENTPVLDYVSMYASNEEYEVGEDIYASQDLKPEQLVEKSLTLLRGYQKGAKLFMEDFENIIMND